MNAAGGRSSGCSARADRTASPPSTGYSPYWIGQIAKRYNTEGPDGHAQSPPYDLPSRAPARSSAQQEELRVTLAAAVARRERWTGARGGVDQRAQRAWPSGACPLGWAYLQRLKHSQQRPARSTSGGRRRTESVQKKIGPLLREVATAFPHARSSCGRPTSIASASSRSCAGSGRPLASGRSRLFSTATPGAIWSASCIRPLVAPSSIWQPPSASPSLRRSWPPLRARQAQAQASRSCLSWTARAGTPHSACACPTMSTCSSCRPIPPNSNPPSISGR